MEEGVLDVESRRHLKIKSHQGACREAEEEEEDVSLSLVKLMGLFGALGAGASASLAVFLAEKTLFGTWLALSPVAQEDGGGGGGGGGLAAEEADPRRRRATNMEMMVTCFRRQSLP